MRLPPKVRHALRRAAQIALTFIVFAFFNRLSVYFEIENGVSILFPAAAISILACMFWGVWAALGVFLATIATPWNAQIDVRQLVLSGVLAAAEGLIPYAVFRARRELSRDLRDMRSFVAFLLFGTIVNTGVSAIVGNLTVVLHAPGTLLVWRQVFVWWIADFVAALLIATPVLAFRGALLRRRDDRPRTIANALQIVTVLILLGFASSFAIRTYLLNRLEEDRLEQQQSWLAAQEKLNRMHSNFLRAAFLDAHDPAARSKLDAARRMNDEYIRELGPAIIDASPELAREFPAIANATRQWFGGDGGSAHAADTGRYILALRGMLDRANAQGWVDFTATRRKIMLVCALVDGMVFLILVVASVTLLYTMSRPFAQLRGAIRAMRDDAPLDVSRIDARYLELQSIVDALEATSLALRKREDELRLQTEKAIKASQHKSDFLAKMSHELRTPLNAIIGFSEIIHTTPELSEAERGEFAETIHNSGKRLLKLINDILELTHIQAGRLELHPSPCSLAEAVDAALSENAAAATQKELTVSSRVDRELEVVFDPRSLRHVVHNLVNNAIKFTPHHGSVLIGAVETEQGTVVEVR
ncbi:MAG: MASE1 domain-containing protein, partial [Acidobacteria bacterium]|nr:MASE1 domain-containing protein [Acidobacteriota bacterium]